MTSLVNRFEALCLPYLDSVYRLARQLVRDNLEAEDLVQETFLRAFRAFERFEVRECGVKPWLLKILHNVFCTYRNKTRKHPTLLDDVDFDHFAAELDSLPEETGIAKINWDAIDQDLKRAVDSLLPEYRAVLLLWSFEDMSYKEIAEVCACPVGTVMSRLYRARRLLEERLADFVRRENVPKKG